MESQLKRTNIYKRLTFYFSPVFFIATSVIAFYYSGDSKPNNLLFYAISGCCFTLGIFFSVKIYDEVFHSKILSLIRDIKSSEYLLISNQEKEKVFMWEKLEKLRIDSEYKVKDIATRSKILVAEKKLNLEQKVTELKNQTILELERINSEHSLLVQKREKEFEEMTILKELDGKWKNGIIGFLEVKQKIREEEENQLFNRENELELIRYESEKRAVKLKEERMIISLEEEKVLKHKSIKFQNEIEEHELNQELKFRKREIDLKYEEKMLSLLLKEKELSDKKKKLQIEDSVKGDDTNPLLA